MKGEVHLIAVDLAHEPWLALTVEDVERYLRLAAEFEDWCETNGKTR